MPSHYFDHFGGDLDKPPSNETYSFSQEYFQAKLSLVRADPLLQEEAQQWLDDVKATQRGFLCRWTSALWSSIRFGMARLDASLHGLVAIQDALIVLLVFVLSVITQHFRMAVGIRESGSCQ